MIGGANDIGYVVPWPINLPPLRHRCSTRVLFGVQKGAAAVKHDATRVLDVVYRYPKRASFSALSTRWLEKRHQVNRVTASVKMLSKTPLSVPGAQTSLVSAGKATRANVSTGAAPLALHAARIPLAMVVRAGKNCGS